MLSLIFAAAIAFSPPPLPGPPPMPPELTPRAEASITAWQATLQAARARHAAAGPAKDRAEGLARLAELDRLARDGAVHFAEEGLAPDELRAVRLIAWVGTSRLDRDNEIAVIRLAGDGWFTIKRDGRQATADAALIVLHSRDSNFVRVALSRMTPLARKRQIDGKSYALIADLDAMERGKPQLYATQWACQGHVRQYWPQAPGKRADDERKRIGWTDEPSGADAAALRIGEACATDYVPPRSN